jgi:hypothetical protein
MYTLMTNAEVQAVVAERLRGRKRERIVLTPHRGLKVRELARAVLSLIF